MKKDDLTISNATENVKLEWDEQDCHAGPEDGCQCDRCLYLMGLEASYLTQFNSVLETIYEC